jgi:GDSL-like Lipase/Acylhydrolase family
MIFLGANDSVLPGNYQHVPLDQYSKNLELLYRHPSVRAHNPTIILVTPPPVNEYQFSMLEAPVSGSSFTRTAENTKIYADACRQVGEKDNLPIVDLWRWRGETPLPGSRSTANNEILQSLFVDGICPNALLASVPSVNDRIPRSTFYPRGISRHVRRSNESYPRANSKPTTRITSVCVSWLGRSSCLTLNQLGSSSLAGPDNIHGHRSRRERMRQNIREGPNS